MSHQMASMTFRGSMTSSGELKTIDCFLLQRPSYHISVFSLCSVTYYSCAFVWVSALSLLLFFCCLNHYMEAPAGICVFIIVMLQNLALLFLSFRSVTAPDCFVCQAGSTLLSLSFSFLTF